MTLQQTMALMSFELVPDLPEDDQFELLSIRNQQIIRESSYSSHLIEDNEHLQWIEQLQSDPTILFYAVKFDGDIIGGAGLRKIDKEAGTADWSFYVSELAHGKGVGLALGVRALDIFFDQLKLSTVTGEALINNKASNAYHQKLGFKKVAQQEHLVLPANELAEIAVFSLKKEEWKAHRAALCV